MQLMSNYRVDLNEHLYSRQIRNVDTNTNNTQLTHALIRLLLQLLIVVNR